MLRSALYQDAPTALKQFRGGEEEGDFDGGHFGGVGTMDAVAFDGDRELFAAGAFGGVGGVGRSVKYPSCQYGRSQPGGQLESVGGDKDVDREHHTHQVLPVFTLTPLVVTDFLHCVVDESLQFIRVNIGGARLYVLDGAMENAQADCLLDKFREVAYLRALRT